MRTIIIAAALIIALASGVLVPLVLDADSTIYLPLALREPSRVQVFVEYCIDGDTFMARVPNQWPALDVEGQLLEITHLGANAPRLGECYGYEALGTHRALIESQWVWLEWDAAQTLHGDFVAHVWYEDETGAQRLTSRDLLWLGAAVYESPWPRMRYADDLRAAGEKARVAYRGLWGACAPYPVPPSPYPIPGDGPYPYPYPASKS